MCNEFFTLEMNRKMYHKDKESISHCKMRFLHVETSTTIFAFDQNTAVTKLSLNLPLNFFSEMGSLVNFDIFCSSFWNFFDFRFFPGL